MEKRQIYKRRVRCQELIYHIDTPDPDQVWTPTSYLGSSLFCKDGRDDSGRSIMRREQVSDGGVAKPLATNTKAVRELLTFQNNKTDRNTIKKMTGGTPEVRSDKSLTLMTFNI